MSTGTGCCGERGLGRVKSWQAQHFGDAIAEIGAGAAFCAPTAISELPPPTKSVKQMDT